MYRAFFSSILLFTLAHGQAKAKLVLPEGYALANALEGYVLEIISSHLSEGEFFLIAEIEEPAKPDEASESAKLDLPYTTLKTDIKKLKQALEKEDVQLDRIKFQVFLTVDESVPTGIVDLLQRKITLALGVDGNSRKLEISRELLRAKTKIVDDGKSQLEQERLRLEQSKLENERSKLASEREMLELAQREKDLKDTLKKYQDEIESLKNKPDIEQPASELPEEEAKTPEAEEAKEQGWFDTLKDLQFVVAAVLLALLLVVGSVIAAGANRKGLEGLSTAIGAVGEGLAAQGGGSEAAVADKAAPASETGESKIVTSSSPDPDAQNPERYMEFLRLVEEKVEVLSNEGNFNFYRHFLDLTVERIEYASAILVAVNTETAKNLVNHLPTEAMMAIRENISGKEGLMEAQKLRSKALQNFYGRIVFDEFTDSPLMRIKAADWLVRLSNDDIKSIALELDDELRVLFLSFFTPTRLALVLESTASDQRASLIDAIKLIDTLEAKDISAEIEKIKKAHEKIEKSRAQAVRSMIDGPRFFAKIIEDLSPENRDQFVSAFAERADMMEQIKKYYIPFSAVETLSKATLAEVFGGRSAKQVAMILYASEQGQRDVVLAALSESQQDGVKEELEILDSQVEMSRRHKSKSQQMQVEICHALLQLNSEGLLSYVEEDAAVESTDTAA